MRWSLRRSTFESKFFVVLQQKLVGLESGGDGMEEGGDEENEEERSREEDRDVSTIHRNGKMGVGIPDAFYMV